MILDYSTFSTKRHENNIDQTLMSKNKTTLDINKFSNKGNGLVANSIARKKRLSRVIIRKSILAAPNKNGRRSSGLHTTKKNNLFDSSNWRFLGKKKKPTEVFISGLLLVNYKNVNN